VSDEFPTLEVVLLASVAVLAWRGLLIARLRRELDRALPRLLALVGDPSARGPEGAPSTHRGEASPRFGAALEPLARAALAPQTEASGRAVAERALRAVRRVKSAAARDLVIGAVLGGSLVYAFATRLAVGAAFYVLGALAALLLLLAVKDRLALARALAAAGTQLADLLGARPSQPPLATAARRCRKCGEPLPEALGPEELGARLRELGTRELFVCRGCGRIEGQASVIGSAPR